MNPTTSNTGSSLPQYQCHKKVFASKITAIKAPTMSDIVANYELILADGFVAVPREYIQKHMPVVGGYYVVYEDGYKSFSPAEAFESGYTKI